MMFGKMLFDFVEMTLFLAVSYSLSFFCVKKISRLSQEEKHVGIDLLYVSI
jgi:hypothetical protein